jgi:hypothetical protein
MLGEGDRTSLDDVGRRKSWPYRDLNSDPSAVQPYPVAMPTALSRLSDLYKVNR